LNFRPGGRFPKGFLFPANLAKVLAGLPENDVPGLADDLFPANPPPGLRPVFPAKPLAFPEGLPVNFRFAKSPERF